MKKASVIVVLAIAIAFGVLLFLRPRTTAHSRVRIVRQPHTSDGVIKCARCGRTFSLKEGKPVPGHNRIVLCPGCGKPSPIAATHKAENK